MHTYDFDLVSEWLRTHFHSADDGKTIDWVIHWTSKTERQKFYGGKNKYSLFLAIMAPFTRHEVWTCLNDSVIYLTLSVTPNGA